MIDLGSDLEGPAELWATSIESFRWIADLTSKRWHDISWGSRPVACEPAGPAMRSHP